MNDEIPLEIKQALAERLKKSFSVEPETTERNGFPISVGGAKDNSTDQWAGDKPRTTGGQEIVKVGSVTYTRLYAGGVINDQEKLKKHGITQQDVIGFLTEVILTYSDQTRLDVPFKLPIGSWTYTYTSSYHPDIPMWTGVELIYHMSDRGDDDVVFRHSFMICPVEA